MKVDGLARARGPRELATAAPGRDDHALATIFGASSVHDHTNFLSAAKWRCSIACAMVWRGMRTRSTILAALWAVLWPGAAFAQLDGGHEGGIGAFLQSLDAGFGANVEKGG